MNRGEVKVIPITDRAGKILDPQLLAISETVHRQLRPHLPQGDGYVTRMKEVFAGGAEMASVVIPINPRPNIKIAINRFLFFWLWTQFNDGL